MTLTSNRAGAPARRLGAAALALVLGGALLGPWLRSPPASAAGVVRYVDDDAGCGGLTPCYATLQAAVNAATEGDIVRVASGRYAESVLVEDKGLAFEGPGTSGAAAQPALWVGQAGGVAAPALVVDARTRDLTGVRVQGFQFLSGTLGVALLGRRPGDALPLVAGRPPSTVATSVVGAVVQDNVFGGLRDPGGLLQGAVVATWSRELTVSSNTIRGGVTGVALWAPRGARVADNRIEAPAGAGVQVLAHGDGVDVVANSITSPGGRGIELRDLVRPGIAGAATGLRLVGNQVADSLLEGIAVLATDGGQLSGVALSDNRVTDAGARAAEGTAVFRGGIAVAAEEGDIVGVSSTGDVVRRSHRPGRTDGAGLALARLTGPVAVRRLLASDGDGPGLLLQDMATAVVTSSVISRNAIGVAIVETPASKGGPRVDGAGLVLGGAPAAANRLDANFGPGLVLDNQTGHRQPTADVDARYNDWGVAYGPDIEAQVRHQPDDSTLGLVRYLPALGAPDRVTIAAEPPRLVADGVSRSQLTATVLDLAGLPVADGALVALTSDLGSVSPAGALVEAEAPSLRRLGVWTTLENSTYGPPSGYAYVRTRDPGARLVWSFDAPAVALSFGQVISGAGVFRAQVDRRDLGSFSTAGPDRAWAWRLLARDLAAGSHTVTVTLESGELALDQLAAGVTTVRGVAAAQLRSTPALGTAQVQALAVGALGARTGTRAVAFTAGIATQVRIELGRPSLPVGGVTTTVRAEARDAWGRLVLDGTPVRFSISRGQVTPETALTLGGWAQAVVTSGTETGEVALRAETGQAATTGSISFVPGPPARIEISSNKNTVPANSTSLADLTVQVWDAWNHLVADGTPVAMTTTLGTLSRAASTTEAGAVKARLTAGARAGAAVVTASSGRAVGQLSIALVATDLRVIKRIEPRSVVLPGETVTFSLELANVGSGTVYGAVITDVLPAALMTETVTALKLPSLQQLQVKPAYRWRLGHLRPGERGAITMTLTVSPTYPWGQRTEVVNELAMFSPTAAERTPEDNVARATLIVVPFAAYTVTLTVPQQLSVGGTTGAVVARVVNREGRPAPDGTKVYFSTDIGLVTPNLATTKGGVTRGVIYQTGEKAGVAAVRAETQEERGATAYVRVVAAPAQTLDVVSARPWLHVGTDTTVITATLRDNFQNPVVGEPILMQTSLGSFAGDGTVQSLVRGGSGPTGQFTATLISGVRTGTAMVAVQSGMLLKRLAIPFRPGPPAQVSIRLSRDQVTVNVPIQVTGIVQDVYGNALPNVLVNFASQIGQLGSLTGVTDDAGAARTTLVSPEPGIGTVSVTGAGQTAFTVLTVQQASLYLPMLQKPRK